MPSSSRPKNPPIRRPNLTQSFRSLRNRTQIHQSQRRLRHRLSCQPLPNICTSRTFPLDRLGLLSSSNSGAWCSHASMVAVPPPQQRRISRTAWVVSLGDPYKLTPPPMMPVGGSWLASVASTGVARPVRTTQLRVHVTWHNMIGLPRVIRVRAFATQPAEDGGVPDSLCSCCVVALIVSSLLVPVVVPCLLALVAALDVCGESSAH